MFINRKWLCVRNSFIIPPILGCWSSIDAGWIRRSSRRYWIAHYSKRRLKYRCQTWGKMTERRPGTLRTTGRIAAGCWPGFPRRRCWGRIQAGNIRPVPPWETGWDSDVCRPSGTGSNVVWCLRYSSSSCWGSWRWRCLRSPSSWDFPLRRSWHFRRRWRWTRIAIGQPAGKESATATWGSAVVLKVLKRTIWIRNKIYKSRIQLPSSNLCLACTNL